MFEEPVRFGIMGLGKIARAFAEDIQHVEGAALTAVASRSVEKKNAFGREFEVPYRHLGYQGLAENEKVDIVYIATPHTLHYENTMACLRAGRGVLVEKPFAMNFRQAKEMVALAQEKKLFLMEGLWTQYAPSFIKAMELVEEGRIGEVKLVQADFGFNAPFDPTGRLYAMKLGGGALLDIGIYPLFLALRTLGMPSNVKASATFSPTGSDETCGMLLTYESGAMAALNATFAADTPVEARICGTEGMILIHSHWHETVSLTLYEGREPVGTMDFEKKGGGYATEIEAAVRYYRADKIESDAFGLTDSLRLMQLLDTCRAEMGLVYPEHDSND